MPLFAVAFAVFGAARPAQKTAKGDRRACRTLPWRLPFAAAMAPAAEPAIAVEDEHMQAVSSGPRPP
jgi:hypothetical protein